MPQQHCHHPVEANRMASKGPSFSTYAEFWPYYLRQHSKPGARYLHFIGTFIAVGLVLIAIVSQHWWMLAASLVVGYGFAWAAHVFIEGNRPATFGHPFWSLYSDFRMLLLWCTGRLSRHLDAAGITDA